MQSTAKNGTRERESGKLDHLRVQYIRRRTELARRMAEANTASLAGTYLKSIKDLDETWVEVTGTSPPPVAEPHPSEPPGAAPAEPRGETADSAASDQAAPAEAQPGPVVEPAPAEPVPAPALEPTAADETKTAPVTTPRARRRWRPSRSQVAYAVAMTPIVAWLVTGVVWVGDAGVGRIIRDGHAVRAVAGPLALKWPWPIEQFEPADPIDSIDPMIEADPRLAEADAEAARRGAATLRAAYQRLQKNAATDLADEGRADELMRRAARAPKREAGMYYRKAAREFLRAIAVTTLGDAQNAAKRWETIPAADRQVWQARVAQASARLDEGARLYADGQIDEARQILAASTTALDGLWNEYMRGLVASATSALTRAVADWDLAMQALAKSGMPDPEPVARARAVLAAGDGQTPGEARLSELREAHAGVGAVATRYRDEQSQFVAARQAAEQARDAFRQTPKAEFPPDISQAEALMDRAPKALHDDGPAAAAAVYRQAAADFTAAVALAAEGVTAQSMTQQRAVGGQLQALRRSIDALSDARSAALRRAAKLSGRVEDLRMQLSTADIEQGPMLREQMMVAVGESAQAARAVLVLGAAGVTEARLAELDATYQGVRRSVDEGAATIPPQIVAQTARMGQVISLTESAVRSEVAAQASARRWEALPAEVIEPWKRWIESPLSRLRSGSSALEAGDIEEGARALEAARQSLDSIWDEYLAETVAEARRQADLALSQWNALVEPLAKLAPREPDQVREARALLEGASSSSTPAPQRAEALRRAASLLSTALAAAKEQRALVNVPGPDGRTPLFRAVSDGDASAAESLLGRGADANVSGTDSEPPLVVATRAGRADLAWMLLAAGADRAVAAADGTPVVFLSVVSPATLQLFMEEAGTARHRGLTVLHEIAKAGIDRKVKGPDQAKMARMVLERFPALLRQKDQSGYTALDLARQRGALDMVQFLTQQESR